MHKVVWAFLILNICIVNAHAISTNNNVLYEYGLLNDVANAQYGPLVSVNTIAKYSNFGIGAGVGLGELIILDGKFYLANPHGEIRQLHNQDMLSIVTATRFIPNSRFVVNNISSLNQLQNIIDKHVPNDHMIYAIKITGIFDKITARSEDIDHPPYTPAVTWMKNHQNVFDYNNKSATLVMFRTPDNLSNIQVKYHAHFISNDAKIGGHVFDISAKKLTVALEPIDQVNLSLRTKFDPIKSVASGIQLDKFNQVVEPNNH